MARRDTGEVGRPAVLRAGSRHGTVVAMKPDQPASPETVRDRLRRALSAAMKTRDATAVAALRSALAAIDNAEAVDPTQAPPPTAGHADLAGTVAGLRATEVARRTLTDAEMAAIVRAEVTDRQAAASAYERAGQRDHAERLRAEAATLSSHLDEDDSPADEAHRLQGR